MRIAYCTNVRLPSERAHGHQVARVCDALVRLGHDVQIFAPLRRNPLRESYHDFHRADPRVRISYLGSFDPIDRLCIPKALQLILLNWQLRFYLKRKVQKESFDLIYTRSPAILPTLLSIGLPTIVELHTIPRFGRSRFIRSCNRCSLVACLTSAMREELVRLGVGQSRIVVTPDAVCLDTFDRTDRQVPLREFVVNPLSGTTIIGYVGQVSSMGLSKGIPELLNAMDTLKRSGLNVHLVTAGPLSKDEALEARLAAAGTRLGFHPHALIPYLLKGCDVLVYPAPKTNHPYFIRDTSPLKIFEYMASERPIVTADLPPIRDILDESTAEFFKPGDAQDLARALERVLRDPDRALERAKRARKRVEEHTWEKRMGRIICALQQRLWRS